MLTLEVDHGGTLPFDGVFVDDAEGNIPAFTEYGSGMFPECSRNMVGKEGETERE